MKKTILLATFILVILNTLTAQPQQLKSVSEQSLHYSHIDNDSLLFDGNNISDGSFQYEDSCAIGLWGRDVKGSVKGSVQNISIVKGCSGSIDTIIFYTWQQLPYKGIIFLKPGDSVVTGPGSSVRLLALHTFKLPFGQEDAERDVIMMGPNSVTIPNCGSYSRVLLKRGILWAKEKSEKFEKKVIETVRSIIKPSGTEYSVEVTDNNDIIRVYEGSVEVKLVGTGNIKSIDEVAKEADKLTEDYKNGKITMEEYMKKSKEYLDLMQGKAIDMRKSVMVEAGFMVTAADKISDPVQIPADDIKWFEEK